MESLLRERLIGLGFDLLHTFSAAAIAPDLNRLGINQVDENLAVLLVGNRTELWERLRNCLQAEPARLASLHPLDEFVEEAIDGVISNTLPGAQVLYGHRRYGSEFVPLQRWAQLSGYLALSPSHLSVHREYGPWLALRAVILFKGVPSQFESIVMEPAREPCSTCAAPCKMPFERAMRISQDAAQDQRVTSHWQDFLAVRDACPVGRKYRYSEDQLCYHYARDRSALRKA